MVSQRQGLKAAYHVDETRLQTTRSCCVRNGEMQRRMSSSCRTFAVVECAVGAIGTDSDSGGGGDIDCDSTPGGGVDGSDDGDDINVGVEVMWMGIARSESPRKVVAHCAMIGSYSRRESQ